MALENNDLQWVVKSHAITADTVSDVVIKKGDDSKQGLDRIQILFRNRCYYSITKNNHIALAKIGERLYFKEVEADLGFKLTSFNRDASKCRTQLLLKYLPDVKFGSYKLRFDRERCLYYISFVNPKD